ncbi:hypothetical protein [Enterococcus faecium]|uniref:hypothetical protein n=1 Tax=Enterococcus faecium TaxID=1352 RepID=UPI0012615522|nr:hypothetical protein [Enterococcus faecium]KAB7597356.1 hypothetical protein GBM58_15315 [Enterococcus faecium]HAP6323894.1 hypothetical protein [Enterococcus faecium]
MCNSIVTIQEKAEEELMRIEAEYKEKRKAIKRKKNAELKKYKEEQALKLGTMLCKYYDCYDINEVLKKANLNQFCE